MNVHCHHVDLGSLLYSTLVQMNLRAGILHVFEVVRLCNAVLYAYSGNVILVAFLFSFRSGMVSI